MSRKDTGFRPESAAGMTKAGVTPLFIVSGRPERDVKSCFEKFSLIIDRSGRVAKGMTLFMVSGCPLGT